MDKSAEEMIEDFKGIVTSVNPNTDPYARSGALEASLRDCLHLLDTAEGYWVSDAATFNFENSRGEYELGVDETPNAPGVRMIATSGTYFRQTFRDTEAVKRARELIACVGDDGQGS